MKILSLIMARAGSKRLKNKNLKKIKNYSLIERAIRMSKKLKKNKIVCDTLLSTDSIKILEVGKKNKVMTPWIRPKNLSQSNSTSADTALHAVEWYENKISLEESFELNFELYFGTRDNGADGLAFCLQPLSTSIGVSGGGLGVEGVNPSFFPRKKALTLVLALFCNVKFLWFFGGSEIQHG